MIPNDSRREQEIDVLLNEFSRKADQSRSSADRPSGLHETSRIESVILADLQPVRPLASFFICFVRFAAIFALLAMVSGSVLGLHGLHALGSTQAAVIFAAFMIAAGLAAMACARAMRPATGLPLGSTSLLFAATSFPLLFALLFRGYATVDFFPEGIPCLRAGMLVATPAGLFVAWLLRRGFVLQWKAAGLAAGTLAGLTGLGMLELHCANLKAIHVIVWHVAVVLVSALLGALLGWFADRRSSALYPTH